MLNLEITNKAEKELDKIPEPHQGVIRAAIEALPSNPYEGKKMKGFTDHYRLRVGSYRVVYRIIKDEVVILVIKVGHRQSVYKDF